jgi:hypothetical protein
MNLERLFLKSLNRAYSDLMIENRIDFASTDVSVLSVEGLDSLLLNETLSVESEDSLLRDIGKLGSDYRDLLRHMNIEFLSEDGLFLFDEHFGIPPESVWQCAVELITHPPFLGDSRIISDFPEIFAESQKKCFEILWQAVATVSKKKTFSADVMVTQTL